MPAHIAFMNSFIQCFLPHTACAALKKALLLLAFAAVSSAAFSQHNGWDKTFLESLRLYEAAEYDAALVQAQSALRLLEAERGPNAPDASTVANLIGRIYASQTKYQDAETYFLLALHLSEARYGESTKLDGDLMSLGGNFVYKKEYERAESTYQRLLTILKSAHGENNVALVEPLRALARTYRLQGRLDDAERVTRQVMKLWQTPSTTVFGVKFDGTAHDLQNLAALSVDRGQYAQACGFYLQALELLESDLKEAKSSSIGAGNGTCARLADCLTRLAALSRKMSQADAAAKFEGRAAAAQAEIKGTLFNGRPAIWGQSVFDIHL
jgi:tetratricopeptide (TPR) repeat protein